MSSDATNANGTKVGGIAFVVGLVGLAIAAVGFFQGYSNDDPRPIMSWLIGIAFWLSMAVGMLFLTQIWYVFHARWPIILRRQTEHFFAVFPVLFVLFIPLLVITYTHENPGLLWKWLNPANALPGHGTVGEDPIAQWKSPYLNHTFFVIRTVLVFAVFIGLSFLLRKLSFDTDKTGDVNNTHMARRLSSAGLFLTAVFATVGAIDWFKSLEYHWFSTMYGVWFFAASMRAALSALLILCVVLAWKGYLKGILKQAHRYDIACMMLAFTIFWTYISFSQYFLIYNANIPEETFWYNIREKAGWWGVSMALIFCNFLTPFLFLLWYKTKVVIWRTVLVASWILVFHVVDLYWNIVPGKIPADNEYGYTVRPFSIEIFDIAAIIGVGGLCIWAFCRSSKKTEPIPVRDPNIVKSLNYTE
ncbi:hypothetical protein [Coraliomargarita akajimensis]|uniref:Quinol:cytochrome c oxidoreductase quinone-binding subunit 2 n=1 Tax=Coraliomargarita akajimensis (strain DSM 45221 / IAM 15411 / JCM 23193 / KCTC 12865 / 04OKA010-24) TaxID=583355 RepID=D5EKH0_CORAD|nr:hypothetical protein [Coraliomargarita akajimensis]ADE53051.1 conserved hypothetical protein [Coraliomargarita akajimensis DSM 45221]